jgi:hypothetical protein
MKRMRWILVVALGVAGAFVYAARIRPSPLNTNPPAGPPTSSIMPASTSAGSALDQQRALILRSAYGTAPIADLLRALVETRGGPEVQLVFQALALRKPEALPRVRERLRTGELFEKFMLTKFLRYSPWLETMTELVALARDTTQSWLPRQGALYALAALGDKQAGPEVAEILREPHCPAGVRLAAISALVRLQYSEAAGSIREFTQHEDIHLRLCAAWALAKFGEPVDREFLLSALANENYIVRQEACGALGAAGMTGQLAWVAGHDPHEGVRAAAAQAVLEHGIRGQSADATLAILRDALPQADRLTTTWILRTMLAQGGDAGHAFVQELAAHGDRLGERSRAYLILADGR